MSYLKLNMSTIALAILPLSNPIPVHIWKLEVILHTFSPFICVCLPFHFQECPIKYSRFISQSQEWWNVEMVNAENSEVLEEARAKMEGAESLIDHVKGCLLLRKPVLGFM